MTTFVKSERPLLGKLHIFKNKNIPTLSTQVCNVDTARAFNLNKNSFQIESLQLKCRLHPTVNNIIYLHQTRTSGNEK